MPAGLRLNSNYWFSYACCLVVVAVNYLTQKKHISILKKLWLIPPTHHKTGKRTRKPLVRPIIPATEEMPNELFAQSAHSHYAIAKNRRDVPQGRATLADIPQLVINTARRHLNTEMEHWTLHDLRRTALCFH